MALLLAAVPASVHFILVVPDGGVEVNVLDDPEKAAPCGTSDITKGAPIGKVTAMTGGESLHIKIKETICHPGCYRIALSVLDLSELPADPEATTRETPRGPVSVSAGIDPKPYPSVLADGLFESRANASEYILAADIKLPNINCEKRVVQALQFMKEHGPNKEGDFSYQYCADLKITANPALPIETAWAGQKAC